MRNEQRKQQKTPLVWVQNLMRKIKENKDELTRRKIAALERKAYDYYLTLYIGDMILNERVDFHPDLYLSGYIICPSAKLNAALAVQQIVKQGTKRINQCYSVLLKNAREIREAQKKIRIS